MINIVIADIGNTSCEFTLVANGRVTKTEFLNTVDLKNKSDTLLAEILSLNIFASNIDLIAISSVVPSVNDYIANLLKPLARNIRVVTIEDFKALKINNIGNNIDFVGHDILAKVAFTHSIKNPKTLILDIGTATVAQYIDSNYILSGVAITIGFNGIYKHLHQSAELLPYIKPIPTELALGNNTTDCVQGGSFWAYIGIIEKIISKVNQERDVSKIYITGGSSYLFKSYIDHDNLHFNKSIVALGIYYILQEEYNLIPIVI